MYSDDEDIPDFESINEACKWSCIGINPTRSETYDHTNLYDVYETYMDWFNNQLRMFEDFLKSPSFLSHESNILPEDSFDSINKTTIGDEQSTLGNHFAPIVGHTLEFVLSQLFTDSPFKIFEIGAGRGVASSLMFKEMTSRFCVQYVLTDPIYKPFDKFIPGDKNEAEESKGGEGAEGAEDGDKKMSYIQTSFDVITQTGIGVTEVIENIKKNHITNSILYICCPPPFEKYSESCYERYISTDLISLVKSIDVPEIKHIIIVRHELRDIDGTYFFDKHIDILNHLHHWYLVYNETVADYIFNYTTYYRKMYVFSRTDEKI